MHENPSWISRISPKCFPLFTDAPSDDRNTILGIRSPTLSSLKASNMHCLDLVCLGYPLLKPNENILNTVQMFLDYIKQHIQLLVQWYYDLYNHHTVKTKKITSQRSSIIFLSIRKLLILTMKSWHALSFSYAPDLNLTSWSFYSSISSLKWVKGKPLREI